MVVQAFNPAQRDRQANFYAFKASLVYIHSSKPANQPPCLRDGDVLNLQIYSDCILESRFKARSTGAASDLCSF